MLIDESYPPSPRDDYQRSKLEAERLVLRYHHQHGLPSLALRPGAFCGPGGRYGFNRLFFEDPLKGLPLQVHGGRRITFPVYIQDVAQCIDLALRRGQPGEVYNVGAGCQRTNLEVVETICAIVDRLRPELPHGPCASLITFVTDRPGHDRRYAIDASKIQRELGWQPEEDFESGLERTVRWYLDNSRWLQRVTSGKYRRERLGLAA